MTTASPLSQRSKRLLEEAGRHLYFAERSLTRLSIGEYLRLAGFCEQIAAPFNLSERLAGAECLSKVLTVYLAERGQP